MYHIQINITLIIYHTVGPPRKANGGLHVNNKERVGGLAHNK